MIHTGHNILPLLGVYQMIKQTRIYVLNCRHIHNSTSRPTLTRFDFVSFAAVTFCFCCLLRVRDVVSVILSYKNTILTSICCVICICSRSSECLTYHFGRLKPPNGVLGQTQESAYHLNHNVSRGGMSYTMIHKIT